MLNDCPAVVHVGVGAVVAGGGVAAAPDDESPPQPASNALASAPARNPAGSSDLTREFIGRKDSRRKWAR
jgi:hypothetical protein